MLFDGKIKTVLIFVFSCIVLSSCDRTKIEWELSDPVDLPAANVNLYIENSGSMEGYMRDGSSFKDAVFGYITEINKYVGKTRFYFVNSRILENNIPLDRLNETLSVGQFRQLGGDRTHTNLSNILKMILSRTNDSTVSVFVSDCILDLPQGPARDYFISNQISTQAIVSDKLKSCKSLSFVVYRMMSHFDGYYYNSDGAQKISVNRPFYIMLVGPWQLVSGITRNVSIARIPGARLTTSVAFAPTHEPIRTFTNVQGNENKRGNCTLLPDRNSNTYRIKLLSDMSSLFMDNKALMDKSTYKIEDRNVKLEYIEKIDNPNSPYTHVLTLSVPQQIKPSSISIDVRRTPIPIWIKQANDNTGHFIGRTTTGIKYLLDGIGAAYEGEDIAEFNFVIKRSI